MRDQKKVLSFSLLILSLILLYLLGNFFLGHSIFPFNEPKNFYFPQNENALCVYNSNSALSKEICEYYNQTRYRYSVEQTALGNYPAPQEIKLLGLNIPDDKFIDANKEDMSIENFFIYVKNPINEYVAANPNLKITHLAVAKDVPTTVGTRSGSYYLAMKDPDSVNSGNDFYGKLEHFDPVNYPNISFMVSYLTGYTLADVKEMINKAVAPAPDYNSVKWIMDKHTTGMFVALQKVSDVYVIGGDSYYFNGLEYKIGERSGRVTFRGLNQTGNVYIEPSDEINLGSKTGTLVRAPQIGKDYLFRLDFPLPSANSLIQGAVYQTNGQNFTVLKSSTNILGEQNNNMSYFDGDSFWGFKNYNPTGLPNISGTLVKISGAGIDRINYSFFHEVTEEINFSFGFGANQFLQIGSSFVFTKDYLDDTGVTDENIILNLFDDKMTESNFETVAYYGIGNYHPNYGGQCWVNSNNFLFNISNRAIMTATESFNARTFTGGSCPNHRTDLGATQGMIADVFANDSFAGTNYSKSFAGAMGHVNEPLLSGVDYPGYFMPAYASGLTLAESAMSGWTPWWTPWFEGVESLEFYDYRKRGITVGDPLMRITDENKKGISQQCSVNNDCLSSKCLTDREGINRCVAFTSSDSCVYGEIGKNATGEFLDGLFESPEGTSYCVNSRYLRTCEDSKWSVEKACSVNYQCVQKIPYSSHKVDIQPKEFVNASCKLNNGQVCSSDDECALGNCDSDIYGVKRCHESKYNCVVNNTGSESINYGCICLSSTEKVNCLNSGWQSETTSGCDCSYSSISISLESGKYFYLTLPLVPISNSITDIFRDLPVGSSVTLWNSTIQNWRTFSKGVSGIGSYSFFGGNSFLIQSSKNLTFLFKGTLLTEPEKIQIGFNWSLFGIPVCYENYTASKLLSEFNYLGNCSSIKRWNITNSNWESWYSNNTGTDFNISNLESYFSFCDLSTNFNFTPTCEKVCIPSLVNLSSSWTDISTCYENNTLLQEKLITQYDSNNCGKISPKVYSEIKNAQCDYCNLNRNLNGCNSSIRGNFSRIENKFPEIKIRINETLWNSSNSASTNLTETSKVNISYKNSAILFEHNFSKDTLDLLSFELENNLSNGKEYLLVKNLNLTENKTLRLRKNNPTSNAVCIADTVVENLEDLENSCSYTLCDGSGQCSTEGDWFIISNLSHSGVSEENLFCGDGICLLNETCSSCSPDCGICSSTDKGASGGGSSGSGGGSGGSSSITKEGPQMSSPILVTEEPILEEIVILNQTAIEEGSQGSTNLKKILFWLILGFAALLLIVVLWIVTNKILISIQNKKQNPDSPLNQVYPPYLKE